MEQIDSSLAAIRAKVKLEFAAFAKFQIFGAFWHFRLLVALALFLVPTMIFATLWFREQGVSVADAFRVDWLGFSLPFLLLIFLPVAQYSAAKKRWQSVPSISEAKEYLFTEDEISLNSPTASAKFNWSTVQVARKSAGMILLGIGQNNFHIIPINSFDTQDSYNKFCDLVRRKVAKCTL